VFVRLLRGLTHVSACVVHTVHAHVHLAGPNTEEQLPRYWIGTVDPVEYGRRRIEGKITADPELHFIRGPQVPHTPERVPTDSE